MIHTPLNYSSAEQWAGFPHTPRPVAGEKRRGRQGGGRREERREISANNLDEDE